MKAITLKDLPIAIEDGEVQVRLRDEDGLSVGYVRLPAAWPRRRFVGEPSLSSPVRVNSSTPRPQVRNLRWEPVANVRLYHA